MPKHDDLSTIVRLYVHHFRPAAERELVYYQRQRTDRDAVSRAARCVLPSGKRHPHQYRIPGRVLADAELRLLANIDAIRVCTSFDELHDLIEQLAGSISGIGELATYDIALRIGARIGVAPTRVYLHSGTREGARSLGLGERRRTLEVSELPSAFRRLAPREIEDVLCIFKDGIANASRGCLTNHDLPAGCAPWHGGSKIRRSESPRSE
jgi:hypothetical protein